MKITIIKKHFILNLFLLVFIAFTSCVTFKNAEKVNNGNSHKIINTYSNKCESINNYNFHSEENLWEIIAPKSKIEEENLSVKFSLNEKKRLLAYLIKDDKIISEKIVKGKFKNDSSYYTKRKLLLIPILPILWFYKDEKMRIYAKKEQLIIDKRYKDGGVAIIMAGGNNVNTSYKCEKLKN